MTIQEKLKEIEEHLGYWMGEFMRKELTTNNVRIIGESICKAIILKKRGETNGNRVIFGNDTSLPLVRTTQLGVLNFEDLIQSLEELRCFETRKDIYHQFKIIQNRTNPSSHSKNHDGQKTTEADLDACMASILQLLTWFYSVQINQPLPDKVKDALNNDDRDTSSYVDGLNWNEFSSLCNDFDKKRFQFILVSPANLSPEARVAQAISKIPWRLVIDFNPKTDEEDNGLLKNFEALKGSGYRKVITINDKPDFDPLFNHYWFLANGQGSIQPISEFKAWRKKYQNFISESLYKGFIKGSRSRTRIVVMMDIAPNYAELIISELNRIEESNLRFVICGKNGNSYDSIFDKFDNVDRVIISSEEIADGINRTLGFEGDTESKVTPIEIPHRNDKNERAVVEISKEHYDYLFSLGIELVFNRIDKIITPSDEKVDFYKGGKVSWADLAEQKDIERSSYQHLFKRVEVELEKNKLNEIELVHGAGGGGTTMARRIAYDLSKKYPTLILRKFEPKKTVAGIQILYDQYTKGRLPFLIVLESHEVKDSNLLFRELAGQKKNALLLKIKRGQTIKARDKKFILRSQLELGEIPAFEATFSSLVPVRKEQISSIKDRYADNTEYISPFIYGLTAFDKDFIGVENYVTKCISDIKIEQKKMVGFISIIYHFTQRAVPAELFTTLLGVDRSKCDLYQILGADNPVFDILHEEYDGDELTNLWRPRHEILGEETMKQLLAGSIEQKNNWETFLPHWITDLVKFIKESTPILDEYTKEILDALFVRRDEYEESGSNRDAFTDLVQRLKPDDGNAVFKILTESYSDEAHFHGHYARYLYNDLVGIRDYPKAIEEAELSLDLQPNDSRLVHTMGMCYRKQAEQRMQSEFSDDEDNHELETQVKSLVDSACDEFNKCIELDSSNVYGHESQIRVLLAAVDFGYKLNSPSVSKASFISNPKYDWYANKLDRVTTLLEDGLFVIEQSKKIENAERLNKSLNYLQDCQGRFFKAIGNAITAKNFYEHLIKQTPSGYQYMIPHYRRMFVVCLLSSKTEGDSDFFNSWKKVSEAELLQSVKYLEDNIFEDPTNVYNVRLWLQGIRALKNPPSIEECISKVSAWTQNNDQSINSSLEGYYYLYVLNSIKAITHTFDPTAVEIVKDIREKMKSYIKNEKFPFEWLGPGKGILQMVNHKTLGEFTSDFFDRNKQNLTEVTGRIKEIRSSQQGLIVLDSGLEAFFVPGIGFFTERDLNSKVKFYVSFRYDQIQAWSVINQDKQRGDVQKVNDQAEVVDYVDEQVTAEPITKAKEKEEAVTIHDNTIKISGPKIIGKIDLPLRSPKASPMELSTNIEEPVFGKNYPGQIKRVINGGGFISCPNLQKDIFFYENRIGNHNGEELLNHPIKVTILFSEGVPQLDKHGNYKAHSVSLIK